MCALKTDVPNKNTVARLTLNILPLLQQPFQASFLKWLHVRLQILSVPLNKQVKFSTKPTLPICWFWFTLLAVQAYNLSFHKWPTQAHNCTITQYKTLILKMLHNTICLSWNPVSLQELQFPIRRVIQKTSVLLKLSNFTFAEFFTSPAKIWCWKPQIITRLELVALFYWKSLTEH